MGKIRKAVIPAAGLGSRFYPLTKAQPKEMLPVLDKPVIHYVVEEAVNAGLNEILIIVGKGKESIINYFDKHELDKLDISGVNKFPEIFFVRQKEQLGLADAVRYSKAFVDDEPFLVLLGDTMYKSKNKTPVSKQLMNSFTKTDKTTIAIEEVPTEKIRDYGILSGKELPNKLFRVDDLIEKPEPKDAPSNLGITGLYALTPEIFDAIDRIKPGKNGEYQLTDALKILAKSDEVFGARFEGKRYDIGTKELWIRTFFEFVKEDSKFNHILDSL